MCEDYTHNTLDVFPVFQVSPDDEGYYTDTSSVTPPDLRNLPKSPDTLAHGSLPLEATGSLDSFVGSPVTSMSLTEDAADLSLLPDPLILLQTKCYFYRCQSRCDRSRSGASITGESLASVDSSPLDLSREEPFDAFCEPCDIGGHPLIMTGLPGCPYREGRC